MTRLQLEMLGPYLAGVMGVAIVAPWSSAVRCVQVCGLLHSRAVALLPFALALFVVALSALVMPLHTRQVESLRVSRTYWGMLKRYVIEAVVLCLLAGVASALPPVLSGSNPAPRLLQGIATVWIGLCLAAVFAVHRITRLLFKLTVPAKNP